MKTENLQRFQNELPGWLLRGALCAANSAVWAVLAGFQTASEAAGMLAGVLGWVTLFAGAVAIVPADRPWAAEAMSALKWAAWLKVGLLAGAWLVYAAAMAVRWDSLAVLAMFGTLDLWLGLLSLGLVAKVAGFAGPEAVATADSFGWTALATVVEGTLMAMILVGLAAGVWTARRFGARFRFPWNSSPRFNGGRCV